MSQAATIYVDGASHGNPGPAGIGAVLQAPDGQPIAKLYKYLGETTNNIAEYLALVYALIEAQRRGIREVRVRTDSELMARQLNGEYKVRDGSLRLFHDLIQTLRASFDSCAVEHIGREGNAEADRLAGEAVKSRLQTAFALKVLS